MTEAVLDIKHWGNNLGVRLPAAVARAAHLHADQRVRVSVEDGRVIISPLFNEPLTLEIWIFRGALKLMTNVMPIVKKFTIPGPAGTLEGVTHIPAAAPRAIAVVAHPLPTMGGTMENKVVTTLAKTFAELGFVALRFNFRGVDASGGDFDGGEGEVEDVLAVARYAQREYGGLPLILSGFSFGGYVQARAAQQLHPQRLVLVAPAVGRFAMPAVPQNTLVIHGEQDEIVPLAEVLQWAQPQHLHIVVLPQTTHFFHGRLPQLREIVCQHFTEHALGHL